MCEEGLVSRNITVNGRRTSIRLEEQMWKALHDMAVREKCSIHDLCSLVCMNKKTAVSLTASIRIFIMMYYKAAATEDGHKKAGHGAFEKMLRRAKPAKPEDMPIIAGQKSPYIIGVPAYDSISVVRRSVAN